MLLVRGAGKQIVVVKSNHSQLLRVSSGTVPCVHLETCLSVSGSPGSPALFRCPNDASPGRNLDHPLLGFGPDDLTCNDKRLASAHGQLQEAASPFRHRYVTLDSGIRPRLKVAWQGSERWSLPLITPRCSSMWPGGHACWVREQRLSYVPVPGSSDTDANASSHPRTNAQTSSTPEAVTTSCRVEAVSSMCVIRTRSMPDADSSIHTRMSMTPVRPLELMQIDSACRRHPRVNELLSPPSEFVFRVRVEAEALPTAAFCTANTGERPRRGCLPKGVSR
jgi:hypothetical protein